MCGTVQCHIMASRMRRVLMRVLGSLYVYSISVALQALTVISMGGIADHRESPLPLTPSHCPVRSTHWAVFLPSCSTTSQTSALHIRLPWLPLRYPFLLSPFVLSSMAPIRPLRHLRKRRLRSVSCCDERIPTNVSEEQRGSCNDKAVFG